MGLSEPSHDDFYIERGFVVFTEAYLRKRGTCYQSGCRHCPWVKEESYLCLEKK